jgi:hypothetical protein
VSHHERRPDLDLSRRDALKIALGVGAAAMIPLVPAEVAEAAQRAVAGGKPVILKFFTVAQHRTVDALTEVIIPADERSPGARAAKVADHLDFVLNESSADARQAWKDGIAAEWTRDLYDAAFYGKSPADSPLNDPGKELYPHAVRGGSWDDEPVRLRSAARRSSIEAWSRRDPQNPKSLWWHTDATFVGFRVVAEP